MKKEYLYLLFMAIFLDSCTKDVNYTVENEGQVYMAQAYENQAKVTLYDIDTLQDVYFGASFGGLGYQDADIQVDFAPDESLISQYNVAHGTAFKAFPSSSYEISGLTSIIKSGKSDSEPLKIIVNADELELGQGYMLPIKLTQASNNNINENLTVAYFRIDSLVRRERDITAQGKLTVSNENSSGSAGAEGSPKLVDEDLSTKYLTTYAANMWFKLEFTTPQILGAYTFTSANDADTRDPKSWKLEGSSDGTTWVTLDQKVDQVFTARTQTRRFEFDNSTAYKYYRIVLIANNGSSLFQMAEWRAIQYY